MKSCDHSQWLGLGLQQGNIVFQETDRLQTLIEGLPDPDTRKPSLFVLIGRKTKSLFLQKLVSVERKNKFRWKRARHGIHLHLDASSAFHDNPVFYADSYLPTHLVGDCTSRPDSCHESVTRPLPRSSSDYLGLAGTRAADFLYSRLLRPFSDVFCLFLADLGGIQPVVQHLASWLDKGRTITVPQAVNPSVIIVVESETPGYKVEKQVKEELLHLLEQETPRSIFDSFFEVRVVSIFPEGKLSLQSRHRQLKERLLDALHQAQERRMRVGMHFSATHFAVFFRHACDHFVKTPDEPFNFIKTSRLRNPVSPEMDRNLSRFLKHIRTPRELTKFAIPIIASSLFLNAYPPDMHDFKPRDVFQELYMDACRRVGRVGILEHDSVTHLLLPSAFVKMVEDEFTLCFTRWAQGLGVPSAKAHLENLQRFQSNWQRIRDNDICLPCLDQTPEYTLPCGHANCELCVQRFWNNDHHPWVFKRGECVLCRSHFPQEVTVKIHNPSRGLRVLSLDGGGIRGIVHLKFLQVLQDRIGLPLPVQENFDFTVGTSCGVLVNLAMFVAGLSVDELIPVFEDLARRAFEPRGVSGIPVISDIEKVVSLLLADSLYPSEGLEAGLNQIFGDRMTMFDCSYATAIGTKIAATVTTVSKGDPCLFTNYRKAGKRRKDCGYHIIQPQDGHSDPRVWQIARCAAAAPVYFTPFDIPGVGAYQDGGLWKNNPVGIVNPEIEAIAPLTEEPLIVSVGTGTVKEKGVLVPPAVHRGWKHVSLLRGWQAFKQKLDSERLGQDFNNQRRLASEEDYYRFNITWDGREPGLDEVCEMPVIRVKAEEQFSNSTEMDVLAFRFIASHFHFELETEPKKRGSQYFGVGHILCDLKRNHPAYRALIDRLSEGEARFYVDDNLVPGRIGDCSFLDKKGDFRKSVEFERVTGKLSIRLELIGIQSQDISGSPFSIEKRIEAQKLNAYFGQASHRKRKRLDHIRLNGKRRRRNNHSSR